MALTVRLDEDMEKVLDLIAKVENRTKNSLISEAVEMLIKQRIQDADFQKALKPLIDSMQDFLSAVTMAATVREIDEETADNSKDEILEDIENNQRLLRLTHPDAFKGGEALGRT